MFIKSWLTNASFKADNVVDQSVDMITFLSNDTIPPFLSKLFNRLDALQEAVEILRTNAVILNQHVTTELGAIGGKLSLLVDRLSVNPGLTSIRLCTAREGVSFVHTSLSSIFADVTCALDFEFPSPVVQIITQKLASTVTFVVDISTKINAIRVSSCF